MCPPAIFAAVAIVTSIAGAISGNKAMHRQEQALDQQNAEREKEIGQQASAQLNERAMAARRERAAARVASSQSGVNLDSNSFLAQLSASEEHQANDNGLIVTNAENQQKSREADFNYNLSKIHYTTGLGIALDAASAGANAYTSAGGKLPGG